MIVGHGIDIVHLQRFKIMTKDRLAKLARRICTDTELEDFDKNKLQFQYVAKIWACKEAIAKAFGTGIRDNVTWKNMQITSDKLGKPCVQFKQCLSSPICHLSISHERDYLIASAILEIL